MWVSPFRYLRIDGCVLLPAAFRSLPRLSSAPGAKASALCSFLLDQSLSGYSYSVRTYPCFFCCCAASLFFLAAFYFSDVLISSLSAGSLFLVLPFLRMDVSVCLYEVFKVQINARARALAINSRAEALLFLEVSSKLPNSFHL